MEYLFHKVFFHTENTFSHYCYHKRDSRSHPNAALSTITACTLTQNTPRFRKQTRFHIEMSAIQDSF